MKRRNPELEVMIKLERIPEVHKKTSQSGTTFGYNLLAPEKPSTISRVLVDALQINKDTERIASNVRARYDSQKFAKAEMSNTEDLLSER